MAADWSQLPKDLLQLISERLNSELYLLRFRSVCSSWRSSSTPKHHLNNYFSTINNFNPLCKLSKHNIFLIKPPQHQQTLLHRPWLIRIGPDQNGKIQLWLPFSLHPQSPFHFPQHVLDFNQLSVLDLGYMFSLSDPNSQKCSTRVCSWDDSWKIISGMSTSLYRETCLFKGRPCMVDYSGETVMFERDLSYHLITESLRDHVGNLSYHLIAECLPDVENFHSKFLLQSECDLLLVDCYVVGTNFFINIGDGDGVGDVKIVVFRLDEKKKKWVKLTSLGDRVLFLGNEYTFSASASELGFANGNCVIYADNAFKGLYYTKCGMSVFHLDQDRVSPLSDYPDYLKLFWPPPEWISVLH